MRSFRKILRLVLDKVGEGGHAFSMKLGLKLAQVKRYTGKYFKLSGTGSSYEKYSLILNEGKTRLTLLQNDNF